MDIKTNDIAYTKNKLWKRVLSVFLAIVIGFGSFVSLTVGNLFLSDYINFKSLIVAKADVTPVPVFYRYGDLVGLYRVNYTDDTTLQYKIGEDGEWTDYVAPFAIPAFATTKVYARVGEDGNATYLNIESTGEALGVYTESCTDFYFSYNNIDFGYTRVYNSKDKEWFDSIYSKALATENRLEVILPDGTKHQLVRKDSSTYIDQLTGDTLTETSSNYIFDDGYYKYYFVKKLLQSVAYLGAIEDYAGNKLSLNRTNNTEEISISDDNGRSFYLSDYTTIEAPDSSDALYYSQKEITDPEGNKLTYTTKLRQYINVIDQAGVTIGSYAYTSDTTDHSLIKSNNKSIEYYDNGRLKKITYDNGAFINYNYDDANKTYTTLTSNGEATKTVYDDGFYPIEYTDEYGTTTYYTYDQHYRVKTEKTNNITTTYSYDDKGNLLSYVAENQEDNAYYTYDSNSNMVREQIGTDYTYYTYDSNKNVTVYATLKEYYQGEAPTLYDATLTCFDTVAYTYDDKSRLIKEVDSLGYTTDYEYDSYGNISKEIYTVTTNGETTSTTTTYTYDDLGNVLTTQCDSDSSSYIYDNAGRTLLANENGDCTRTIYDGLGRIVQEIAPEDYDSSKDGLPESNTYADSNAGHTYIYDSATGNLVSETNRLGITTTYTYSDIGTLETEEFDIYKYVYNINGNVEDIYITNNNQMLSTHYAHYTYNQDNLNTAIQYGNGQTVYYTYDSNGNLTSQQYQSSSDDSTFTQYEYVYNDDNELTCKIDYVSNTSTWYTEDTETTYLLSFDESGNPQQVDLISSYQSTQDETDQNTYYHSYGNISLTYSTDSEIVTTSNGTFTYTYTTNDDSSANIQLNDTNGTALLSYGYTYNEDGTTNTYSVDTTNYSKEFKYIYDSEGRITQYGSLYDGVINPNDIVSYHYDSQGQLVRADENRHTNANATSTGQTNVYTYDSRGNLTTADYYQYTTSDSLTTYNPSESLELEFNVEDSVWVDSVQSTGDTQAPFIYDANGNLVDMDELNFHWSNGRQLSAVTYTDEQIPMLSYTYDENGIRTSKTFGDTTTYYITNGGSILAQYQKEDGEVVNLMEFFYNSGGELLGFTYNGQTYFYIKNAQGDVTNIIDTNGNVLVNYYYYAYGEFFAEDNSTIGLADINPMLYRGYYYDFDLGAYYLQSRYYLPQWCRFINADIPDIAKSSKELQNGMNLFAYCNNDPVNNSDPTGYLSKIKWKKGYVKTETIAILIDMAIAIISPAVSASYDATGYVLKKTFKNFGEHSAEKFFVKNIKPIIKKELSKFGNAICSIIIKLAGRTLDAINGALINKCISCINKIIDYICRVNFSTLFDIVMLWTSIGGVIAFMLDFVPDLEYSEKIYKKHFIK